MILLTPNPTRTYTLFPYTTLFRSLLRHELGETPPRQLLAKLHASRHRCAVNLENLFCQVHSNHSILRHGCRPFRSVVLNTTILAHRDAVWEGGNHPILAKSVLYGHIAPEWYRSTSSISGSLLQIGRASCRERVCKYV